MTTNQSRFLANEKEFLSRNESFSSKETNEKREATKVHETTEANKTATTSAKRRRFNESDLVSDRGITALSETFAKTTQKKLSGARGAELDDLKTILNTYRIWAYRLHPGLHLYDLLDQCSKFGSKSIVKQLMASLRTEQHYKIHGLTATDELSTQSVMHDDFLQKDTLSQEIKNTTAQDMFQTIERPEQNISITTNDRPQDQDDDLDDDLIRELEEMREQQHNQNDIDDEPELDFDLPDDIIDDVEAEFV